MMATYLFLWKKSEWSWENIEQDIKKIAQGEKIKERWSTGRHKNGFENGNQFVLMKLGEYPKGIIACGTIENFRYEANHWNAKKDNRDKKNPYVDLNIEILSKDPLIDLDELKIRFSQESVNTWTPRSNGKLIPEDVSESIFHLMRARSIPVQKINQRVLFARISYMDEYQGPVNGLKPMGGGQYNEDHIGSEASNYLDINGKIYGYFQPSPKSQSINLERIDPKIHGADKLENVLVIFFAPLPKEFANKISSAYMKSSSVIVGWYKNATVFRDCQYIDREVAGVSQNSYYIEALTEDTFLLPVEQRVFSIGHGIKGKKKNNPGQSNSFYIFDENLQMKDINLIENRWISDAVKYVNAYTGPLLKNDIDRLEQDLVNSQFKSQRKGAGFQTNTEVRLLIEDYAMIVTKEKLEQMGYQVKLEDDRGQKICSNSSYDMLAYKDDQEYFVEVKGTQLDGSQVIFTRNEVQLYEEYKNKIILSVVHSIKVLNDTIIKKSGDIIIHYPWEIDKSKLKAISYFYTF